MRVGPNRKSKDRLVHANLLCQNSPFFRGALAHEWREKRENLIRLPKDDIETFDTYCAWLYHRNPFSLPTSCNCSELNASHEVHLYPDQKRLLRAWMFGNKILDYNFCDMVIDALIEHATLQNSWPYAIAFTVFQVSSKHAPVRRLLTDIFVHGAVPEWFDDGAPELNEEAYQQITLALLTKGNELCIDVAPWKSDPCVYHWHKHSGGVCYKNKGR